MTDQTTHFNLAKFAGMLKRTRGNIGLRKVAEEIGDISFTTLSRVENGKMPDIETAIKLCHWMQVPFSTFVADDTTLGEPNTKNRIITILLGETERLGLDKVRTLMEMVKMAYESVK